MVALLIIANSLFDGEAEKKHAYINCYVGFASQTLRYSLKPAEGKEVSLMTTPHISLFILE